MMTKAAERAADSLAAEILNKTAGAGYGPERPDILEAVASTLKRRASELRQERIDRIDPARQAFGDQKGWTFKWTPPLVDT